MWELTMDTPEGLTNTVKFEKMQKTCKIMMFFWFFLHLINMPCNPHAAGQCATHVRNHLWRHMNAFLSMPLIRDSLYQRSWPFGRPGPLFQTLGLLGLCLKKNICNFFQHSNTWYRDTYQTSMLTFQRPVTPSFFSRRNFDPGIFCTATGPQRQNPWIVVANKFNTQIAKNHDIYRKKVDKKAYA